MIGVGILAASIIVIAVSLWFIFLPPLAGVDLLVLKLTGSVAVAAIFGILAWIGYTLATTPPPKPIEEIEKEMEQERRSVAAKHANHLTPKPSKYPIAATFILEDGDSSMRRHVHWQTASGRT